MLENGQFKDYLELVPDVRAPFALGSRALLTRAPAQVRDLLRHFTNSEYQSLLQCVERLRPRLDVDIHARQHAGRLLSTIRERALAQYFEPYLSVDMRRMAEAFNCAVPELELELVQLIGQGRLAARIDSDLKVLHARTTNQRTATFTRALEVGEAFEMHVKAMVMRTAMQGANLKVQAPGRSSGPGGRHDSDGGGRGMGPGSFDHDRGDHRYDHHGRRPRYGRRDRDGHERLAAMEL